MRAYLHIRSLAEYLHIHGGQAVDLKRDGLVVSPGLAGIEQYIDLHGLVRNQDSRLTVHLQVRTVLVLALDAVKMKTATDPKTLIIRQNYQLLPF